jgi:uncharacterized membrane protein YkoI
MGADAEGVAVASAEEVSTAPRSSCVQQRPPMDVQNNSGQTMLKMILAAVLVVAFAAQPAAAGTRHLFGVGEAGLQLAAATANYPIHQAEAAMIAKSANPGSTVLSVKLLPSGAYAVTLKVGGSVLQVMVDATTGAII